MGKRCPACRKPVSEDAVICTNCGFDRRTRGRVIVRGDGDEPRGPSRWAWAYSPAALAAVLLLGWMVFFLAAAKDPALTPVYRGAVLVVGGGAVVFMVAGLIWGGMDLEEWVALIWRPEFYLLQSDFEGYAQVVLLTAIAAGLGIPFLAAQQAGGVHP